jgi:hypothetical protein
MSAAYTDLLGHAELELELAGRGDVAGVLALGGHWDELVAGLPGTPPPEARELLERALLMHERTRIELIRLREALLSELDTTRRARRTAEGYAGAMASRPRLDRSA